MSEGRPTVIVSGARKKYTVAPAATRKLLSREELRGIDRYVATASVTPKQHSSGGGGERASAHIPELPFERVPPCQDAVLQLRVSPVRSREPALNVPLRFAAPEEFHLPPLEDPPSRAPIGRRVAALIKGSESVTSSWAAGPAGVSGGPHRESLQNTETRAQSAIRSGDHAGAARLFCVVAALHYSSANLEAAVAAFQRALPLFESAGNSKGVAFCHNVCGVCCYHLGEPKVALVHWKKQEALGAAYSRCIAQLNMGVGYTALGELQFAEQALEDALKSSRESAEPMLVTIALGNLGAASLRAGNMRAAQTCLEECLELCSLAGDKSGAAVCLLLLGQVYAAIHDFTHALFYFDHAYRIGGEAGLPDIVALARVCSGATRGNAALRDAVLREAATMGKQSTVHSIIGALPP